MIPEAPFYLEGAGGLFEFVYRRLRENGHVVLVVAEGAGQDLVAQTLQSNELIDASGNHLLRDIGHWLSQQMKVIYFSNSPFTGLNSEQENL
jgi:6-phosphofructokinase 1